MFVVWWTVFTELFELGLKDFYSFVNFNSLNWEFLSLTNVLIWFDFWFWLNWFGFDLSSCDLICDLPITAEYETMYELSLGEVGAKIGDLQRPWTHWLTCLKRCVAMSPKRCKIDHMLSLTTDSSSYVGFRLAPKSMILNEWSWTAETSTEIFLHIMVAVKRQNRWNMTYSIAISARRRLVLVMQFCRRCYTRPLTSGNCTWSNLTRAAHLLPGDVHRVKYSLFYLSVGGASGSRLYETSN